MQRPGFMQYEPDGAVPDLYVGTNLLRHRRRRPNGHRLLACDGYQPRVKGLPQRKTVDCVLPDFTLTLAKKRACA